MKESYGYYQSPIGCIEVVATTKLLQVSFVVKPKVVTEDENLIVQATLLQLEEYFHHERQIFTVPLAEQGTAFQNLVWQAAATIPYGATISYQELASEINHAKALRAVGTALGKNPWAIIVACHRVVSKNNPKIINYAAGPEKKLFLQEFEQKKHS